MFILLVTSMLTLAFNIQPVKASGTIYIRADGSIDPSDALISTFDNITYTFTGDIINESIVIERDNIVVDGAGYMLQGTYAYESIGTDVTGRTNVTIKNTNIKNYWSGIYLESSLHNSISGNNITENNLYGNYPYAGICLYASSNYNSISDNNISNNGGSGILLYSSNYNSISGNNLAANNGDGIVLYSSSNHNSISENNITNNKVNGIHLDYSSDNSIVGNNITNNGVAYDYDGVGLYASSDNTIVGNNIRNNGVGIGLSVSSYNSISGNNITNNGYYGGIYLYSSSDNRFFHNNFINNTNQVYSTDSVNVWDDGYPSGGNYWSDYSGTDGFRGPFQNETGSDGIGDTQYSIDSYNTDRYPLMNLWVSTRLLGDINGDGIVDIYDAILLANAYNSTPGKANWNPNADINGDNIVDIYDAIILANHYN
jgi:parallel beta-helix repeat protein